MIPTTVSSSPSTATANSNSSGGSSCSASGNSNNNSNNSTSNSGQQNTSSIMIGLASLILEGRAIAEDEFHPQPLRSNSISDGNALSGSGYNGSGGSSVGGAGGSLSSTLGSGAGRQSPTVRPSTSRAAATVGGRVINITTNPYAFGGGATCVAYDTAASPLYIDPYSSSSASSSAESTHQRWTQKLCQLRQASPAASLSSTYEQPVAVDGSHSSVGGDPELLALSVNETGTAERSEFEIVRRVMLSHANVSSAANVANSPGGATGSASSSPGSGSENLLFSLQSLATTCLRSGPSLEPSGGGISGGSYRYTTLSPPTVIRGPAYSYRATPPSAHRFPNAPGSGSSSGSGIQSPKSNWNSPMTTNVASSSGHLQAKEKFLRQTIATTSMSSSSAYVARASAPPAGATNWLHAGAHVAATTTATTKAAAAVATSSTYPQQGPHCDQFLRKMGLAKGEAAEAEEHFCDMTYVNITCSRWRAYCLKMEGIIGRGEPVCIEVYLGPVGHKILLEQWIITQKEKLPPPIMTLPSLCSAIRSQLYFSQISAWCDLIKKSDITIYDTGRIIFPNPTGAAGDLATPVTTAAAAAATAASGTNVTPGTSPTSSINQLSNAVQNHRPRLNIFYRIKPYDSTACFNSKPNVHNFPNVNISENCSISVCLKSLPRINGGIPKVGATSTSAATTSTTTTTATAGETVVTAAATAATTRMATTGDLSSGADVSTNGNSNSINGTSGHNRLGGNGARMNAYIDSLSNSNVSAETPRTSRSTRSATQATAAGATSSVNCDMNKVHPFAENTCSPLTSKASVVNRKFFNAPSTSSSTASSSSSTSVASGCASASNGCGGSGSSSSTTSKVGGGKNKCMFFIDEEELLADEADGYDGSVAFDEDDNRSDTANSTGDSSTSAFSPCANMSHREKQLLKYRKRMLKRDKKHQRKPFSNASDASCEMGASEELQRRRQEQRIGGNDNGTCQPMEQGEEESVVSLPVRHIAATITSTRSNQISSNNSAHIEMISTGTQTPMMCCQQCGSEKTFVCLKCLRNDGAQSPLPLHHLAPTELDVDEMDDSASSISSSDIIHTPRNKAELLLQAIQRTPKAAKHKKQMLRATGGSGNTASSAMKLQNNNHLVLSNGGVEAAVNGGAIGNGVVAVNGNAGCQVCKRQKTQHNFGERGDAEAAENTELEADAADDDKSGKVEESTYNLKNTNSLEQPQQPQTTELPTESQVMEEESFLSSTKLTPHISGCASNTSLSYQLVVTANCAAGDGNSTRSCTPPGNATHMDGDCCTENKKAEVQFKTPTTTTSSNAGQQPQKQCTTQRSQQQTPKPNLLQISCNYQSVSGAGDGFPMLRSDESMPKLTYVPSVMPTPSLDQQTSQNQLPHNPLLQRKGLPKVNLTPIFCNPTATAVPTISNSHSSPIPIHGGMQDGTFSFDATTINRSNPRPITSGSNHHPLMHSSSATNTTTTTGVTDNIPVQKSYSAPTLPNSPSLSPRFAKQAAIYKRRSRHLSDRSDRSSLGSDEQFSDEDLESGGVYSPATSPLKQRTRIAAAFGRQPLLGNLEESLLQKRLMPKVEVMGFKVLLGASGGFCPTQLTIPAAAYFYELHGETLSTPYMCEIRLPRKGYSVPRVGTVQATLLNPMGTVVRMFVIPYDMHDMPALHQTFIRQRILAEASSNEATQNSANIQQVDEQQLNVGSGGDGARFANDFASNNAKSDNGNKINNDAKTNSNSNSNNNNKYRLSPSGGLHSESNLGHFISAEHMKRLRYSIHLRFQTSRSGRLSLHTDIRLLISRRTDCDTAAAHAKGVLEAPNDLVTDTVMPSNPKYSARPEYSSSGSNKI